MATYDVQWAYLQAKPLPKGSNERVLTKLEGEFVDIAREIYPNHKKNMIYKNGKNIPYKEIVQAVFEWIESVTENMIWCELYSQTLETEWFTINPYGK